MSAEAGALLEPLSVALAGLRRADVRLGDAVVVCGAGPIGLAVLLCVAAAGATPIVVTDLEERRLAVATELVPRARPLLVATTDAPEQVGAKIREAAGGRETDVAIECTGVESSVGAAVWSCRFGGRVFVIGVGKDEMKIPFMRASTMEVDVRFQFRYANTWPLAISLVESGVVDLRGLITHRFGIEQAEEAFKTAADPKTGAIKVIIMCNE